MKQFYLDIHVLQIVPPSCVNRDDTGSPKTAIYGGVPRARVSSQAWKHAMRENFSQIFQGNEVGLRTKKAVGLVADALESLHYEGDVHKAAINALENAGIKVKKENTTDALLFISKAQVEALAQCVINGETDKAIYKQALQRNPSVDMALFGRMVASDPSLNYDACAQVAHSISTHEVRNEYDYFTAVDDCETKEQAGAGHLGAVEFNSATLYRYATINIKDLMKYLGAETAQTVDAFVKSFLLSMPTGKQNTFANRTVPDFAYITLRQDQPVNLAGAFEKPIYEGQGGYVSKSLQALEEYAKKTYTSFVTQPTKTYCIGEQTTMGETFSLEEVLKDLHHEISTYYEGASE